MSVRQWGRWARAKSAEGPWQPSGTTWVMAVPGGVLVRTEGHTASGQPTPVAPAFVPRGDENLQAFLEQLDRDLPNPPKPRP
jgi:hypothetical protein